MQTVHYVDEDPGGTLPVRHGSANCGLLALPCSFFRSC